MAFGITLVTNVLTFARELADRTLHRLREEADPFPVDWRTVLSYAPYYAAFNTYVGARQRWAASQECPAVREFDRRVRDMVPCERRNFVLFVIYQLSCERDRRDHAYYCTVYQLLQRLLKFPLWEEEHEMIYLGRAFLRFVPREHPRLMYWPLGEYLDQVAAFRAAARPGERPPARSHLGSTEELLSELLARLGPEATFGYNLEISRWRSLLEEMLAGQPAPASGGAPLRLAA